MNRFVTHTYPCYSYNVGQHLARQNPRAQPPMRPFFTRSLFPYDFSHNVSYGKKTVQQAVDSHPGSIFKFNLLYGRQLKFKFYFVEVELITFLFIWEGIDFFEWNFISYAMAS